MSVGNATPTGAEQAGTGSSGMAGGVGDGGAGSSAAESGGVLGGDSGTSQGNMGSSADTTTRPEFMPGEGAGASGGQAAAQAQADQAAAQQWQSIREAARAYGYDLSQYQDDSAALAHLVQAAQRSRQADYYAQLGRQLAPHAQGIGQYLQQQRTPAPATEERPAWQPPEMDDRWLALVERDPSTGVYIAKPGVNPVVADKVNAYSEWMATFAKNPTAVFEQYAQKSLPELVQKQVAQMMGQWQRNQTVDQIMSSNDPWLYARDASGRTQSGMDGRPMLSPMGTRYMQHVQTLAQSGMTDPRMQDTVARRLLMGEMAMAQGAVAPPANPAMAQQAASMPNVNALQGRPALERANTPGATDPNGAGLSLADMLRREFEANGVSDTDFRMDG